VSAALIGWLFWRVPPSEVAEAAAALDWLLLTVVTGLLVLGLYFWDAVCLRWLFAQIGWRLRYGTVLHARGCSYLLGAVNYELGQALLAWKLSQEHGFPLGRILAGCVLLGCHDLAMLLGLGLVGSLVGPVDRLQTIVLCSAGIVGLVALRVFARRVSRRQEGWLAVWSWRRSARLLLLRGAYYGLQLTYAAVALGVCNLVVDARVIAGVIPLVLLVVGLPISVSGLGTRETALKYLLAPAPPAVVVAFGLFWTAGLITGRLALGLAHTWLPHLVGRFEQGPSETSS
jgi:hypothetical protein